MPSEANSQSVLQTALSAGLTSPPALALPAESGSASSSAPRFESSTDKIPAGSYQYDDMRRIFEAFDLDKSGRLDKRTLRVLFGSIGRVIDDSRLESMISLADRDGDGFVTFSDFTILLKDPNKLVSEFKNRQRLAIESVSKKAALSSKPALAIVDDIEHCSPPSELSIAFGDLLGRSSVTAQDVRKLYRMFSSADIDKSGSLDWYEFHEMVVVMAPSASKPLIRRVFDLIDTDRSGLIEMNEFLIAVLSLTNVDAAEKLRLAFSLFDENGNGVIDENELRKIITANSPGFSSNQIEEKMKEVFIALKREKFGDVTFNEFLQLAKIKPGLLIPQAQAVPEKLEGRRQIKMQLQRQKK